MGLKCLALGACTVLIIWEAYSHVKVCDVRGLYCTFDFRILLSCYRVLVKTVRSVMMIVCHNS